MAAFTWRMCPSQMFATFQKVRLHQNLETTSATLVPKYKVLGNGIPHASQSMGCRCVQSSARNCKMWEVPNDKEVQILKKKYQNPKTLINDLLRPLVDCGMTRAPRVVITPRLLGQFWKAQLHLLWPSKVTVSAVHSSVTGAEENVYLLACDLFKNIGFLYEEGSGNHVAPVNQDHVMAMLKSLHTNRDPFSHPPQPFHFTTIPSKESVQFNRSLPGNAEGGNGSEESDSEKQFWRTDIVASWPYTFNVHSLGPSIQTSQYAAVLLTCMKLKSCGLLSRQNRLAEDRLLQLSFHHRNHPSSTQFLDQFNPDYEIYSDASALGFGAYLLKKNKDRVDWFANAWFQHFPDFSEAWPRSKIGKVGKSLQLDSTFCELYALVAACYTWKHKFVGKRLLVWTDNQAAVQLVNCGVLDEGKQERWGKLYRILASTCQKYSIQIHAAHVQRTNNVAADLLSRRNLIEFKKAVPEAAPSAKKTKKLLFWNPLQCVHHKPRLKHV